MKFAVLLSVAVAVVVAKTSHYYPSSESHVPIPYRFKYYVDDHVSSNDFGHEEESDGNVVTGSYFVLLPDGRRQVVNYRADHAGYTANVKYETEPSSFANPTLKDTLPSTYQPKEFPRPYYQSHPRNSYAAYNRPYPAQAPYVEVNPPKIKNLFEATSQHVSINEVPAVELTTESVDEVPVVELKSEQTTENFPEIEHSNREPTTEQTSVTEFVSVSVEEVATTVFAGVVEPIAEPVTERDIQPTTEPAY